MQLTLDGKSKIDISIAILREFEPPEGYYLADSGGKDSSVLKALADLAGVKYDAHYSMTTVDPPELTRFIKREHPDTIWEVPEKNFFELCFSNGLPTRIQRWCCKLLKESGGVGRIVATGVRTEESANRSKRKIIEPCARARKTFINPIRDWTHNDVWEFIRAEGLPYCSLYDEGFDRIGCVVCPFMGKKKQEQSMERWPTLWKLTHKASNRYWAKGTPGMKQFPTAEDYWQWWISGRTNRNVNNEDDEQQAWHFIQE